MSLKGKRVGVIMGGLSSEREVSLKSGSAVLEALKNSGFDAVPLEVKEQTEEGIRSLLVSKAVDVVFVAMHGGFGEDGSLQRILEGAGVPFTGPKEFSSRLAMDKLVSRTLFRKVGLNVPRGRRLTSSMPLFLASLFTFGLKYPLVVKPSAQGSSIGISFIDRASQLPEALSLAFRYGQEAMAEEFIAGREITVSVLNGSALPVVEIIPKHKFFDYQAKYEKGLTEYVVPAVLDENMARRAQRDAVAAYHVLGCRHLSRVDMIVDGSGTPYVLEVNTIPGMTSTSLFPKAAAAAGISFAELCVRLLELASDHNG